MFKGLGNLANISSLIKQAQQMSGKLQQVNEELKTRRVEGGAGGGMVTVEVNGIGEVIRCRIDPSLVSGGDRELIEDLLPAAVNSGPGQSQGVARRGHEVGRGGPRRARPERYAVTTFGG